MICYRDMTFCVSPNCTNECGRKLTSEIEAAAEKWWGGPGAPIATACFCGDSKETARARALSEEKGG